eukprot:4237666-Prymnesium_polylepis.1
MALRRLFFSWCWQCLHPSVRGSMSARPRANRGPHGHGTTPLRRELSLSGRISALRLGRGPALIVGLALEVSLM